MAQRAAEKRTELEMRILSKAGRQDEERLDIGDGDDRQRMRMWSRWFDPATSRLPADLCAPLQKAEVRARRRCPN